MTGKQDHNICSPCRGDVLKGTRRLGMLGILPVRWAWTLCLLPALLTFGCVHYYGYPYGDLFGLHGDNVGSNGLSGVSDPLFIPPGQTIPGAGFFNARVVNDSTSTATVTLQFLLVDTLVHETRLKNIKPATTTVIAGPEIATRLLVNGVNAAGVQLPPGLYVFGVDVDEDTPAIYIIEDVGGGTSPGDDINTTGPDTGTNGMGNGEDTGTNGPDTDTNGLGDDANTNGDDVDTNGGDVDTNGDNGGGGPPPVPSPSDCNSNGIADADELAQGSASDCNANSQPDDCDLAAGDSNDVNNNAIPDECEPDCNANGLPDDYDIDTETSSDCNDNGVPDECDVGTGHSNDVNSNAIPDECEPDCNANGLPDDYEIAGGTGPDCNTNGVPDECDIAAGTSGDCQSDGIPDECEPDCNTNGIADDCDIATGTSADCNTDGVPDECQLFVNDILVFDIPVVPPVFISDGSPPAVHTFNVSALGTVADVDVDLNITRTYVGDLRIDVGHLGVVVIVYNRECGGEDNFTGTVFDDEAPGTIACVTGHVGSFTPSQPLAAFYGFDVAGDWTITVTDLAGGDSGHLLDWSLHILRVGGGAGDCNANGILDDCDIAFATSPDCDTNGVPDACDRTEERRVGKECRSRGSPYH